MMAKQATMEMRAQFVIKTKKFLLLITFDLKLKLINAFVIFLIRHFNLQKNNSWNKLLIHFLKQIKFQK